MKLDLERAKFLKAWQTSEKYIASKTTIGAMNGIRITANEDSVTLEATDLKSSVKLTVKNAEVQEPGTAVLNAAVCGDMLRKSNAPKITLEVSDDKGTLKAGKNRSRFPVIPADTFPKIPESSGAEEVCEIMASDLGKLITEGSCAASAPSDFPKYMGTCLLRTSGQYLITVSTDGKRLARSQKLCTVHKEDDLLLPAPALKEAAKNFNTSDMVKILADGSTVWFVFDRKVLIKEETKDESSEDSQAVVDWKENVVETLEFSIQRIEASFPKFERILNNEVCTTLKASKSALLPAIERVDIIAKNNQAHIMAMILNPGSGQDSESEITSEPRLRITARAPELGTASEVVDASVEGQAMQIGFNAAYFLDGLKAADSDSITIEFSSDEGQTRILKDEGADFLYMLMPIRLTPRDIVPEDDSGDFQPFAPEQPEEFSQDEAEDSQEDYTPQDDTPQYNDSDAPF